MLKFAPSKYPLRLSKGMPMWPYPIEKNLKGSFNPSKCDFTSLFDILSDNIEKSDQNKKLSLYHYTATGCLMVSFWNFIEKHNEKILRVVRDSNRCSDQHPEVPLHSSFSLHIWYFFIYLARFDFGFNIQICVFIGLLTIALNIRL